MVKRIEGNHFDHGEYEPCKDITIGALIEYLEQFPKTWRISVRSSDNVLGGNRFVLIDEYVSTVLTEKGEGLGD